MANNTESANRIKIASESITLGARSAYDSLRLALDSVVGGASVLSQELAAVIAERDTLRGEISATSSERDTLRAEVEKLRESERNLTDALRIAQEREDIANSECDTLHAKLIEERR